MSVEIEEEQTAADTPPEAAGRDSSPAIRVQNLHRYFRGVHAVRDLSFTVDRGDVVGFVGANGAGKTTTMRMLATLDYPDGGSIEILGHDAVTFPEKARKAIGWVPDDYGTYPHMTVLEYLDFFARSLGYRGEDRCERIAEVIDFTHLGPLLDRFINKLSKGMGQRLCLARALLHDPEILIMDEPAAGLDPKARVELKRLIQVLAEDGKTVFISSHILSELDEMCNALLFINQGQLVHHGKSEQLRHANEESIPVRVRFTASPEAVESFVETLEGVTFLDPFQGGARLSIRHDLAASAEESLALALKRLSNSDLGIHDFHREERKLEDAFIDILDDLESKGESIVS